MYRSAMDLQKSQFKPCGYFEYFNRPYTEAPFDAYSSNKNDMGMKAGTKREVETVDGFQYGLFGRGDADFLVEPQTLKGNGAPDLMPAYEVNVTVMVMHNGSPIVYSRTYLPEYKEMHIEICQRLLTATSSRTCQSTTLPRSMHSRWLTSMTYATGHVAPLSQQPALLATSMLCLMMDQVEFMN